jgi:hypothetical protein
MPLQDPIMHTGNRDPAEPPARLRWITYSLWYWRLAGGPGPQLDLQRQLLRVADYL